MPRKNQRVNLADSLDDLVSLRNLGTVWRMVKEQIRDAAARDALDFLDWEARVAINLKDIRESIVDGTYEPERPFRYELPKGKGAFRVITAPNLRDVLVYRLIAEILLEKSLDSKVKGAFFSRRRGRHPVGRSLTFGEYDYPSFFEVWIRYQEYRSQSLLAGSHSFLVVSDISNYFDSVSHELLHEYLAPTGIPRELVATLGRLLDGLKPTTRHSRNPRIGIPVDEYDCSRALAHLFLFEHDRRIVQEVGEDNYARWMDDQNVGVESETQGRRIVHLLTSSLSTQRLTLNAGKTMVLSLENAFDHFQVEANVFIGAFRRRTWSEGFPPSLLRPVSEAREDFEKTWAHLKANSPRKGHWQKIVKQAYLLAAQVESPCLEQDSLEDLIEFPESAHRIFEYYSIRNAGDKLAQVFEDYCLAGECIHEAVPAAFFESCLTLNPAGETVAKIRSLASRFIRGELDGAKEADIARAPAALTLYWFSPDYDELKALMPRGHGPRASVLYARAWVAIMAALEPDRDAVWRTRIFGNPHSDLTHLADFIGELRFNGHSNLNNFANARWHHGRRAFWYEPRTWLRTELLSGAKNGQLRNAVRNALRKMKPTIQTEYERSVFERAVRNVNS